jgi:hypothetical protein
MKMLKAPLPSSIFVTANKFKEFIDAQLADGMTYIVGHTRFATRGDPKINTNNHPFVGTNNRFMLVHNGAVVCAKYDKNKDITDTYILVEAINAFLGDRTISEATKLGFEDVERSAKTNNGVIVVGDPSEVIFCKSRGLPMTVQIIPEKNVVFFASTADIMEPEANVVVDGVKKKRWEELNDEVIMAIDVATGETSRDFLATKKMPSFTSWQERLDLPEIDIDDFVKDSSGKWVRKPQTSLDVFADKKPTQQTSEPRRSHKKGKGHKKHKHGKNTPVATGQLVVSRDDDNQRTTLRDIDRIRSSFDEDDLIADDVEDLLPEDRPVDCFECGSSKEIENDDELLFRLHEGTVDCEEFGYEMNANEARRCPFFNFRHEQ